LIEVGAHVPRDDTARLWLAVARVMAAASSGPSSAAAIVVVGGYGGGGAGGGGGGGVGGGGGGGGGTGSCAPDGVSGGDFPLELVHEHWEHDDVHDDHAMSFTFLR
jgi:hypothetical protein